MGDLLAGQVAIVTGGGQGIGLAIAEEIVAHGGMVLVADVDGAKAKEAEIPSAGQAPRKRWRARSCSWPRRWRRT